MIIIIRKSEKRKKWTKLIIILVLILTPIITLQLFALNFFEKLNTYYVSYFTSPDRVKRETFVPLNSTILQIAEQRYETLLDYYHIPFNLSGSGLFYPLCDAMLKCVNETYFNTTSEYLTVADPLDFGSEYNQIVRYEGMGHNIGTTGVYLMGQAFKYAVGDRENNETLKNEALFRIRQHVDSILFFYNITGEKFLPRWVFPNTTLARSLFHEYYYTPKYTGSHLIYPIYHNATESWWYLLTGTSKDLHLGILTAFAFIYLFCEEIDLRTKIQHFVDNILQYYEGNGWRFIDADGKTHDMGAELWNGPPLTDPIFVLAFLQVGRLVNYDRWNPVYVQYLFDRGFIHEVGLHETAGIYDFLMLTENYFDIILQVKVLMLAAFFEPDPLIRTIYLRTLEELSFIWHYHRNAYLDLMYLAALIPKNNNQITPLSNFTDSTQILLSNEDLSYFRDDVRDCLMRYALTKYPKRTFQNPVLDYQTNPYFAPINGNYSYYPEIGIYDPTTLEDTIYIRLIKNFVSSSTKVNISLPVDMRATVTFIWEKSCFTPAPGGNSLWQAMPVDYLTPYWMARYMYLL